VSAERIKVQTYAPNPAGTLGIPRPNDLYQPKPRVVGTRVRRH